MAGKLFRGTLVGSVLLAATACSGGGSATVATTVPTIGRAAFNGFAECAFPPGGLVTTAGLATVGPTLAVSWDTPQTIPTAESSALVISLGPYRIGFTREDASLTRSLFDSRTGARTELSDGYTETEQGISFVVPMRDLPRLEAGAPWKATVSIDGTQVARCPETGSSKFGDPQPE
jgi:hypothetical protein